MSRLRTGFYFGINGVSKPNSANITLNNNNIALPKIIFASYGSNSAFTKGLNRNIKNIQMKTLTNVLNIVTYFILILYIPKNKIKYEI